MKSMYVIAIASLASLQTSAQTKANVAENNAGVAHHLYIDVHHLGAGKVTAEAVAGAHAKDLVAEKKYGVNFIKYWVDEAKGDVYCLSSSPDEASITKTHADAHGLLPAETYLVTDGQQAMMKEGKDLYLDVHQLGAGNVTAAAVAEAHKKDLAVEGKYDVNFINYWVNEKEGVVLCLSQAPSSDAVVQTHKEAHGLLPVSVEKVKQGE